METNGDFTIIGLTTPDVWDSTEEEAEAITGYLSNNPYCGYQDRSNEWPAIDFMHIRKIDTDPSYVRELLRLIPSALHCRLTLHSHPEVLHEFKFGGLHLKNGVNFNEGEGKMRISRSCHSLEEFLKMEGPECSYSFLSPIFDSISKEGYNSKFSLSDQSLLETVDSHNIIALGGVTPDDFQKLYAAKFAGAALLGYLWSPKTEIAAKIHRIVEARIGLTRK